MGLQYFPIAILIVILVSSCADPDADFSLPEWHEEAGYRWAELKVPARGEPGFELLSSSRTGIQFMNTLTEQHIIDNRVVLNGSGVALGDVTGNGFTDIYFCRLDGPNVLYKNLGNFQFEDMTEYAGVGLPDQFSTGAVFADLNGNGYLDLIVTSIDAPNRVFFNDGTGKFTERENALQTDRNYGSTSIAVADINGNGALDIYITNYKERSVRDIYPYEDQFRFIIERVDGEYRVTEKFRDHYSIDVRDSILVWVETGEPDLLYLNDGNGSFTQVSLTSGVFQDENGSPITEDLLDWGLHAKFHDITGNGYPDLYVCNDFESPDRIWINNGDGTFRLIPPLAIRKTSVSSMAVDFSDINRNGHTDIFVIEMLSREHSKRMRQMGTTAPSPQPPGAIENRPQYLGNVLQMNRGDNTYAEIAEFSGVRRSDWSWGTLFLDVDLKGYEDILITTGHHYDVQDFDANNLIRNRLAMGVLDPTRSMLYYPKLEEQNVIFRNKGNLQFEKVSTEWGFTGLDVSHGMAMGDLNNNGVPDIVVNKLGYPPGVYRNKTNAPRVAVRLRGLSPNTQGIGSKITFHGGPVLQTKEVVAGGSYLSGNDPLYVFATGDENEEFTIEVEWRSGKRSVVNGARKNRIYEIDESAAVSVREQKIVDTTVPFFENVSHLIHHTHHEDRYDDFRRQPLLPLRLSQPGPGIAWSDIDGNGYDDLIITTGKGGSPAVFKNNQGRSFTEVQADPLTSVNANDQTGVIAWKSAGGNTNIIVAENHYESEGRQSDAVKIYSHRNGIFELVDSLAGDNSCTGPVALGDYSGNGYPDLFVGGRVIPGRYPEPASSRLYINTGDRFILDEENTRILNNVGLVSGAVFSDLDGSGSPELILAIRWGPVKIFKFQNGELTDMTGEFGFDKYVGWWNGVTTGDINGNGRPDIIATNWGLNHPYHIVDDHPVRVFYDDFSGDGNIDIIEAYYDDHMNELVPRRGYSIVGESLPFIREHIHTYARYAESSLNDIFGNALNNVREVKAATFEHMIFFNQGDMFEAAALPQKAQFAPAFAVAVADLNGNGHEDVFISQNFFAYHLETPRNDAGRGLWLRGDGTGNLEPVPGHISGIQVYGEQRGAALADFNNNGKIDIIISQNAAQTVLYQNTGAKPGLRVRLEGEDGNPSAIGAAMRIIYNDDEPGPVRSVHAGSGYLSQNSVTQVLGLRDDPKAIWIRWPGGSETTSEIPSGARDIVVRFDGNVTVKPTDIADK